MRICVQLFFLLFALPCLAQLNPSFEDADTINAVIGWKSTQGHFERHTIKFFVNSRLPFTASQGAYFVSLANDTLSSPRKAGMVSNRFAFNDTPGALYFDAFYIPVTLDQHARFSMLLSRWNGISNDTILYHTDTIGARLVNGTDIPLQWTRYGYTLKGNYRQHSRPDSATLSFTSDDIITGTGSAVLHLDNISFGSFAVGEPEFLVSAPFSCYPNPASDQLYIDATLNGAGTLTVYDLSGKLLHRQVLEPGRNRIETAGWQNGLYCLVLENGRGSWTRKIQVSR